MLFALFLGLRLPDGFLGAEEGGGGCYGDEDGEDHGGGGRGKGVLFVVLMVWLGTIQLGTDYAPAYTIGFRLKTYLLRIGIRLTKAMLPCV